jgi:phosphoribosylamine---glycine ligase
VRRLLVVGSGGREHALCWALRRELPPPDTTIWCAPGNPGTADIAVNLAVSADDLVGVASYVEQLNIQLTVIGPEGPLARGLADHLRGSGRRVFGPIASAARIEASKAFAKELMAAAGVRTARSAIFTAPGPAMAYVDRHGEPLVVKASGLAAGKGAIVCNSREEARRAVHAMLEDRSFGEAGATVVVEEFLPGEELSVFAITNGHDVLLLPAAQDHKRLLDGDQGPNTGGMGAYSPVSIATPALLDRVEHEILRPTLAELERVGAPFRGVLYAGLMIAPDGEPWVVEFNCRLGDPEAQAVLPLVSGGLVEALRAAADGEPLPSLDIAPPPGAAVTTVLTARRYPERPETGAVLAVPADLPSDVLVFHAGTRRREDGALVTSGGRVLAVTAVRPTFAEARSASVAAAERIEFEGKHFRRDIGWREAARLKIAD